jgi:nucleoid DNA-binding protein
MNEILTSRHIAEILAGKTGYDAAQVEVFLGELAALVNEETVSGQPIQIRGIGTFKVKLTKERIIRDADTGEMLILPPCHKLAFVPAESFDKLVNRQFESFPSESKAMEEDSPAGPHVLGEEEEEIEDEEIIDSKRTEIMEEKHYPMPPVPAGAPERTVVDEAAGADDLPLEGQQPGVADGEIMDGQTQQPDLSLESWRDEETQYAGSFGAEKPDDETQLRDCSLESLRDEETQYAGSFGTEKPDEETQLRDSSLESLRDEETQYAGSFGAEKPDDETQLRGCSLENLRDEETQYAGGHAEEPVLVAADSFNGAKAGPKNPPFNPTQIALAVILLLVLCGGIWYLVATRGAGLFHRDRSGWISGESFALPGDSAALEQARQKASVAQEVDSAEAGAAASTDSVPPAATDETASASTLPGQERATKKATADSGKKTLSRRPAKSPAAKSPAAASNASSGKVLARVTMPAGNRLTLLALKYYGDKIFWVYIYDFNKTKIGSNPDIVPAGMELQIPAKEVYGIDANSAASREKARLLQAEIKGRSK